MSTDTPVRSERTGDKSPVLDVGAGDPDAPANAIPNLLAHLVETETWRNAATILTGVLLIGLGYWAYTGIRDSIVETRITSLEALLGTVVKGLDVWVGEHRTEAARLARDPEVIERANLLAVEARGRGPSPGKCTAEAEDLRALLQESLSTQGVVAFRIIDRTGLVLASRDPERCGQRIRSSAFRQRLDLALDGAPQFVRPYPDAELSVKGPSEQQRRPVAWFLAPIRNHEAPVAVLAVGVVADRDLAAGHIPALEPAARPLTLAAALAVAARGKGSDADHRGIVARPYRSYRGSEVIGVWQWLPAYDIGVIAEISTGEALATLRYLWISFSVIGGFTVLSLAAAVTSSGLLTQLQRKLGRLQRLGAYTLERQISEGGMATIYLARHALLKRPTAIKVLKKTIATDEFVHRFEREVQLASQLQHPNTVQVFDFGRTREGQPYYVMEYLDGVTLTELVQHSGPVPPGRAVHILRQVGAALREAHAHGMIHRDVKPENVMLCRRGEDDVVKLLDFGLVKNIEHTQTRDITKQLKILGTPRYMAPERILDPTDADERSDIYALGAVGYFLLTGKPIFVGDDNLAITSQVLHVPAPRASESGVAGVPEALDALIAACLEKDRARRPQTMDAVIEALDRQGSRLAWTHQDAARWWASYRESRKPNGDATSTSGRQAKGDRR